MRGAATGQGLFTTQLHGVGSVAMLSHGGTICIPVDGSRQVAVDPQAYVAHVGQVQVHRHQIRRQILGQPHGPGGGAGLADDLDAGRVEHDPQAGTEQRMIVNEKRPHG